MKLYLTFSADRICLPLASYEIIQGLIYRALREDPAYSRMIHESGNIVNGRAYKLFCFSELIGKYSVENGNITYYNSADLEVRSMDPHFITLLFSFFTKNPIVRLGHNIVEVTNLHLGEAIVFSDSITVKTLSPITVYRTEEDKHTTYFSPNEEIFCSSVESNALRKWQSFYGTDNDFSLNVCPLGERFVRRATRFKNTFITAWHGMFELNGSPQTLTFLYNTGLGCKNSQGFGLFEIID